MHLPFVSEARLADGDRAVNFRIVLVVQYHWARRILPGFVHIFEEIKRKWCVDIEIGDL